MVKLRVSELQHGMVLAKAVTRENGSILLPMGAEIREKHLHLLKASKIETVMVQGSKQEERKCYKDLTREKQKEVDEIIDFRFQKAGSKNPFIDLLKDVVRDYLADGVR